VRNAVALDDRARKRMVRRAIIGIEEEGTRKEERGGEQEYYLY
jgi:hypothetical protein